MRILILFDLDEKPPQPQTFEAYRSDLADQNWESEAAVLAALTRAGHECRLFGVHDDISPLLDELARFKPRLVFNLCEAFRGERGLEPQIAGLLELQGIRVTGASSATLRLCKDKALAKDLVRAEGIAVPRDVVVPVAGAGGGAAGRGDGRAGLAWSSFPALVKPLGLESSQGISREAFVTTPQKLAERVAFVHERLGQDALVEEYIEGRELYLAVLGDARRGTLEVFPPRELFFGALPEGEPRVATFRAKWDDGYRSRWRIRSGSAHAPTRSNNPMFRATLDELGRRIARALRLDGYARLDLRLTPGGRVYFLEANPNPSLSPEDDFARAAAAGGRDYDDLIARITTEASAATAARAAGGRRARRRAGRAPTSRAARADSRPRRP